MADWHQGNDREGIEDVARRLEDARPELSALELDRIKLRAKNGAARDRPSLGMRVGYFQRRLVSLVVAVALMMSGSTAVIAAQGGLGKSKKKNGKRATIVRSAAHKQYCPKKSPKSKKSGKSGKSSKKKPCSPKSGKSHKSGKSSKKKK